MAVFRLWLILEATAIFFFFERLLAGVASGVRPDGRWQRAVGPPAAVDLLTPLAVPAKSWQPFNLTGRVVAAHGDIGCGGIAGRAASELLPECAFTPLELLIPHS